MTAPAVSVVIPTRNRVDLLMQTIRSVLLQQVDLEIIAVDEGSTDGTAERLEALRPHGVRCIRHEVPRGLALARNAGLAAATADVVAFVDDDDLYLPGKLGAQLAAMGTTGRRWSFGGALTFSQGPVLHAVTRPPRADEAVALLPYLNAVPGGGSNVIASRSELEAVGGFDPAPRTVEDWDLWIRLSQRGEPAVVPVPVVAYRRHPGNMSRRIDDVLSGTRIIDERYRDLRGGESLDWADLYRWLARAALTGGDRRSAMRLHLAGLRAGYPGAARRLGRTLVPIRPRPPVAHAGEGEHWLDRWRPRRVVPWPDNVEGALRTLLDEQED